MCSGAVGFGYIVVRSLCSGPEAVSWLLKTLFVGFSFSSLISMAPPKLLTLLVTSFPFYYMI